MVSASNMKNGNIIKFNGELCLVVKLHHITPGKGRAHLQASMKNILKGNKVEYRFRPDEKVDIVRVESNEMEFLYDDGQAYTFMDMETYEQIEISKELVGDAVNYLIPNTLCSISVYEGNPISVALPKVVELEVTDTEPVLKGATAAGSNKPATLETGVSITIPPFIEIGEKIRVDTEQNKYLERVK